MFCTPRALFVAWASSDFFRFGTKFHNLKKICIYNAYLSLLSELSLFNIY